MKKENIPQDDAKLLEGKTRDLCYAVDENGNYTTGLSTGWDPKNAALQHSLDYFNERADKILEKVRAGKLSLLAYQMERRYMDVSLMADYMELTKRQVKRHMKPKYFDALDEETVARYADILRIDLEELKTLPE